MPEVANSRSLVPAGVAACVLSFPVLFFGALSTGGGHGSYSLWYAAVVFAGLAALFLVVGTGVAVRKKRSSHAIVGVVFLIVSALTAIYFWEIAEWVADLIFK